MRDYCMYVFFSYFVFCVEKINGNYTSDSYYKIAVAKGNLVELLGSKGETVATLGLELSQSSALAYDSLNMDLYISGTSPKNVSIFRKHITKEGGGSFPLQPIVYKNFEYIVHSLAYDSASLMLFWTTGPGRTIMKAQLNENKTELAIGSVLHRFEDELPFGIAVDSCNRTLYWTNCNIGKPTIERSSIDGEDKMTIVKDGLFKPMAVAVSTGANRYLYWIDEKGYDFTIERCALDGSQRQKIIQIEHQQPSFLTAAGNRLYWTDVVTNSVWSVLNFTAVPIRNYSSDHTAVLKGVISGYQDTMAAGDSTTCLANIPNSLVERVSGGVCLNGLVTQTGSCLCAGGYTGINCEISLCHNYCLNSGECTFYNSTAPTCRCPYPYFGDRCHIDLCSNKCLNGGSCIINEGEVDCSCLEGFAGDRCQFTRTLCDNICVEYTSSEQLENTLVSQCRCPVSEASLENMRSMSVNYRKWQVWSLGGACLTLLAFCIVLAAIVFKLKGRPRLIRRYQVNANSVKNSGRSATGGDCEIAIENCCNMNICDTPCYEPEFRAPGKNVKTKKEEKCGLLSNMEVQPPDTTTNDLF